VGHPVGIHSRTAGRALWYAALLLALAGSGKLVAADPAAVSGHVALPPDTPNADTARMMAEMDYQQGASGGMGMPAAADPPVAVVYAEPRDDATRAAVAAAIAAAPKPPQGTVAQKGLRFVPSLLPILVGTTVVFPNEDDVYHNVFSYSPAKTFDLGRYGKNETPGKVTFDKAGIIKVFCEIHEHMRCTILVLDTPYFATTDPAGHYQLTGVAPGAYTLTAWVNDHAVWTQPWDARGAQTTPADFAAPK
jgi:plastocyanin